MPTAVSEIRVPELSSEKYQQLDCPLLDIELSRLIGSESELAAAQEKRINDSKGHALYYGWGKGDGVATIELTKTLSEKIAINKARAKKGC